MCALSATLPGHWWTTLSGEAVTRKYFNCSRWNPVTHSIGFVLKAKIRYLLGRLFIADTEPNGQGFGSLLRPDRPRQWLHHWPALQQLWNRIVETTSSTLKCCQTLDQNKIDAKCHWLVVELSIKSKDWHSLQRSGRSSKIDRNRLIKTKDSPYHGARLLSIKGPRGPPDQLFAERLAPKTNLHSVRVHKTWLTGAKIVTGFFWCHIIAAWPPFSFVRGRLAATGIQHIFKKIYLNLK